MIRLRNLVLEDAKNTRHGELAFRDLMSGSSVTGLYGQNGSGKTTVIDAIQCLKDLMTGRPLADDAIGFIRQGADHARIVATFEIDDTVVEYAVMLERADDPGETRVSGETVTMTPAGDGRRRTIIEHAIDATADDMGLRGFHTLPRVRWRSLRSVGSADQLLGREETLSWSQGRSFAFSPDTLRTLSNISDATASMTTLSRSRRDAIDGQLKPLLDITSRLSAFARDGIRVVTTRTGSSVSFDYTPLMPGGATGEVLDISRPARLPAAYRESVLHMIRQADMVMPALVPGLHIACDMTDARLENGDSGVEVFIRSVRDNVSIPLWAESEGVRRIIGILSLLIRMFNEEDTLIAIDEIDSGIYEILLGDLLATLAARGVGQLVFTAHNLRVLEALEPESIVFSTTDPERRFTTLKARATNNLRDMYIRAVSLGDHDGVMADRVKRSGIAMALYEAGLTDGGEVASDGE